LNPANSNSVISNSLLLLKTNSLRINLHSFTLGYFELPMFRTIFRFPWEFEIAGFNCILSIFLLSFYMSITLRLILQTDVHCKVPCWLGKRVKRQHWDLTLPRRINQMADQTTAIIFRIDFGSIFLHLLGFSVVTQ